MCLSCNQKKNIRVCDTTLFNTYNLEYTIFKVLGSSDANVGGLLSSGYSI